MSPVSEPLAPPRAGEDGAGFPHWETCVVVFAGSSWDGPPSSEKQLALSLRRYARVVYVDPPVSVRPRGGRDVARLLGQRPQFDLIDERLARLTVMVPPAASRPIMRTIGGRLTDRAVSRTLAKLGAAPVAVITAAITAARGPAGAAQRIFYGTDDFVAGATLMGLSPSWLAKQEHRQVTGADIVLAVTSELSAKWQPHARRVVVFPNGCDDVTFAATDSVRPAADVTLPAPMVGFMGYISERIDLRLLEAVADRGCSLLLVGPVSATSALAGFDALVARPNVQWVGPKQFGELPSYLSHVSVGVTPYADTAFNRASYPLKTLEYLAGGRAVVSTDLPAARTLPAELVALAATPAEFADAVERALYAPADAELTVRRRAYAASQGWAGRGEELARLLGLGAARS